MRNIKALLAAAALGLAAVAGFTGCASDDRTAQQYFDDNTITYRVKWELTGNPAHKFEDVSVKTYRGVVQLNGSITDLEQRQAAEQIAMNVSGVLDVVNNLSVKSQFQSASREQTSASGPASETIERAGDATHQSPHQPLQEQLPPEQPNPNQP